MPRMSACLLAFVVAVSSGCEVTDPVGPEPALTDAPVEMSEARYVLTATDVGWQGELEFTFHNLTARTISLLNCRGGFSLRLEK